MATGGATDKDHSGSRRSARLLRAMGPVIGPTSGRDMAAGAVGVWLGLLLVASFGVVLGGSLPTGAVLIAPMGATAIILLALPNSPLAQPWSAVVGNSVSAMIALAVHQFTQDPVLTIAFSACLSLAAMFLTRSLHPPGGAVALTAALNPGMLDEQGIYFVIIPVFLGTLILVGFATLWHRLNGRVYPFRQPRMSGPHDKDDQDNASRHGLSPAELDRILMDFRQSANLGAEDLARLIAAAEKVSAGHALGAMTCDDVMSRDLVTVPAGAPVAQVARLFRKHGFTSIPVVGEGSVLLGVIFQLDLIRHVRPDATRRKSMLWMVVRALRRARASGVERAVDIMSTDLPLATRATPVAELLPLLDDGGTEAVPIMEQERLVGIVTRTDLLSALARSVSRRAV